MINVINDAGGAEVIQGVFLAEHNPPHEHHWPTN
jgi:hypothetical protein